MYVKGEQTPIMQSSVWQQLRFSYHHSALYLHSQYICSCLIIGCLCLSSLHDTSRNSNTHVFVITDSMLLFLVDEDWRNGRPKGIDGWVLVRSGVFVRWSFSER